MKKLFLFFIIFSIISTSVFAATSSNMNVSLTVVPAPAAGGSIGGGVPLVDYFSLNPNRLIYTGIIVPGDFITTSFINVKSEVDVNQNINVKMSCDGITNCAAQFCSINNPSFQLNKRTSEQIRLECKIPLDAKPLTEYMVKLNIESDKSYAKGLDVKITVSSQEEINSEVQRRKEKEQQDTIIAYGAVSIAAGSVYYFLQNKKR